MPIIVLKLQVWQPSERRTTWNEPQYIYTKGRASRITALSPRSFDKILECLHRNSCPATGSRILCMIFYWSASSAPHLKSESRFSRSKRIKVKIFTGHCEQHHQHVLLFPESWPANEKHFCWRKLVISEQGSKANHITHFLLLQTVLSHFIKAHAKRSHGYSHFTASSLKKYCRKKQASSNNYVLLGCLEDQYQKSCVAALNLKLFFHHKYIFFKGWFQLIFTDFISCSQMLFPPTRGCWSPDYLMIIYCFLQLLFNNQNKQWWICDFSEEKLKTISCS